MKNFVSDDDIEKALKFLWRTAEDYAKWKARARYLDKHRKSVRAAAFLSAKGSSAAENNQHAENSQAYRDVLKEYEEAEYNFTLLDAQRNAAQLKLEAWRTIAATNRQGNI